MSRAKLCVSSRFITFHLARGLRAALNYPAMNALSPVRILVVDDDPALRDLLTDYLAANGFVVDAANDGVEMLARLAQAMPDAIVLDLMLPGEDGLSLARGLAQNL